MQARNCTRVGRKSIDAQGERAIVEPGHGNKSHQVTVHGPQLVFASGARPDRSAVRAFVEMHDTVSIAFDPAETPMLRVIDAAEDADRSQDPYAEKLWMELVTRGLSFDLVGISPAPGQSLAETSHHFDYAKPDTFGEHGVLELLPGAHLSGGEKSLPVLKAQFALCRDLVRYFADVEAVVWPPAQSAIGRRFFESTITAWIEGGTFPALGLAAIRETEQGGLQSVGLDYIIGQEVRVEPSLASDKVDATRLAVRLINQLVLVGRVTESELVIAPDGRRLRVEPSEDGKFVKVQGA